MEQPPGESSPKKARGPFYSPSLEAITEDITDSNAWSVERLKLELHTLAAELAQRKLTKANDVLSRQVEQLEYELKRTRAGSTSSDRNSKTRLIICNREALDWSNEEDRVLGTLEMGVSFFLFFEIYLFIYRDIDPNTDLALTWLSGLCFEGTTSKLPSMILYLDSLE